jgi:hypothetical protein
MRGKLFGISLIVMCATGFAQQTIYFKKDHVYAGPGGPEIAIITPPPTDTTAPSAPTLSSPTPHFTSVDLTWTASTDTGGSGLAGYKVYRRAGTGANIPVATVGPNTLSFTDQPLKPGITYTFTIVAFDKAQNHSAPSSGVNVLTSSDTTPPGAPANMAIAYTSPTSVSMTWTASNDTGGSGIQGYRVYRDGALFSPLIPSATRMFVDTTLAANTPYTYEVHGVDNVGNEGSGISRTVFRDDFHRANATGLNTPYWPTTGSWNINTNQARVGTGVTTASEAMSTKSFGAFKASVTIAKLESPFPGNYGPAPTVGLSFWANDTATEKYVLSAAQTQVASGLSLQYVTPTQTTTLQTMTCCGLPPTLMAVDASIDGSGNRIIKVSLNDNVMFTYTDTVAGRRNTGRIGLRGSTNANEAVRVNELVVVEKGGTLTSTDIVPANVRLTYLSSTSMQVDWDASADIGNGVAGYEVYRGTTLVSGGTPITATTFQDTGLTANTTAYSYTVKAVDNAGTRYASLTKTAFRDDFNRTNAFLSNTGWASNSVWSIASNVAQSGIGPGSGAAYTTNSFNNVRATVTFDGLYYAEYYEEANAGIAFWSDGGTNGYFLDAHGLWYSGTWVGGPAIGNGTVRVEANSSTRLIKIYLNNTLIGTYLETDQTRRNSGKVGIGAGIAYSDLCDENTCAVLTVTADTFSVEEQ